MSSSDGPDSANSGRTGSGTGSGGGQGLVTDQGQTKIADVVVQKIAGLAAQDVSGVHELGGTAARALGAAKERIAGSRSTAGQGVRVEVGDRQAAIDLDVVVEYGVSIADLANDIRRNVISSIEQMVGLEVTEVNISVHDVHLPDDDDNADDGQDSRVQ